MLNGLWLGFFVVAMVSALAQWLVGGNAGIFAAMVESIFAMAKLSVEVMVLLFGTLTLWLVAPPFIMSAAHHLTLLQTSYEHSCARATLTSLYTLHTNWC